MYLILIIEAQDESLVGSVWEIDDKGEYAICIAPNMSNYSLNCKIPCSMLGEYTSKKLERLNENL